MEFIPYDKSWLMRVGLLDLIHGSNRILEFVDSEPELNDDVIALGRAINAWRAGEPVDVGESGTLYRFLQFTAWKQGLDKRFIKHGTLKTRAINSDPSVVNWSQAKLLSLDHGTSQWASATALNGDPERLPSPPFKLALTYEAIDHYEKLAGRWEPRQDATIARHADIFEQLLAGKRPDFEAEQAEDYCFAYAFGYIDDAEGLSRWPALVGHESNRIDETRDEMAKARAGRPITSRDHRVVQAVAMWAKLHNKELEFTHPQAVAKTWPQFWDFLESVS